MPNEEHDLIVALHQSPVKASLVVTGGGTSALSALFGVAGASRSMIEAHIPYAMAALDEYVGHRADSHVSADEAKIMAMKAYQRARRLTEDADSETPSLAGISCTAAIATDRVRRGENRCHVGWHNGEHGAVYSLVMQKGSRNREEEETLCKRLILNAMAEAFGIDNRLTIDLTKDEEVQRYAH